MLSSLRVFQGKELWFRWSGKRGKQLHFTILAPTFPKQRSTLLATDPRSKRLRSLILSNTKTPGNIIVFETYKNDSTAPMPSPPRDSRSPKRRKTSLAKTMNGDKNSTDFPDLVRIVEDGDLVIVARGGREGIPEDIDVPLLVSSHVLRMASPFIQTQFARGCIVQAKGEYSPHVDLVLAVNEEEPSISLICNILHLQHQRLPTRLSARILHDVATTATQWQCVQAIGRTCYQWFDNIHTGLEPNPEPFQTMEAAYLLDDAISFARFTGACVLGLGQNHTYAHAQPIRQRLADECHKRRAQCISDLRADIDLLADAATFGLGASCKHYINMPVEMEIEEGETADECEVDKEGADVFVAALRDQMVWPSTLWPETVGEVVKSVQLFQVPEYDDSDGCEFCEGINKVFKGNLALVQRVHKTRLWGLCLDCFKHRAIFPGQCRVEHAKPS